MSPQAQRIAIAKACGKEPWWRCPLHSEVNGPECPWCNNVVTREDCPDYPNDLNAMHEAEKTLITGTDRDKEDTGLVQRYWMTLYDVCGHTRWPFDATAEERSAALCRTLGMWKEDT